MDNEIMNYEEVMEPEIDTVEVEVEESGIGTGLAMLIGAGIAAAGFAAGKLARKVWTNIKAKKELRNANAVDEDEVLEEVDENVTK